MLILRIAARYIFARKSHSAVNTVSAIATAGIMLAAAAMVCVMSVFNGFASLAVAQQGRLSPPLLVEPVQGKYLVGADTLAARLRALPGVRDVAAVVSEQALAVAGDRQMPVTLLGVDDHWSAIMPIDSVVIDGAHSLTHIPGAATLSAGVAVTLAATPQWSTPVELYMPRRRGRINPAMPLAALRSDTLYTTAVFASGNPTTDASTIILRSERLQRLLALEPDMASALALDAPESMKADVAAALGPDYRVSTRAEQHQASFRMIAVEKWVTLLMLTFILLIASFNIVSTMTMLIIEKERSIFIFEALGMERRRVSAIFMVQGWLITMAGGMLGILLGAAAVAAQQQWGFIRLGGDPSRLVTDVYPVALQCGDLGLVLAIVAAVGVLTSLLTLAIARRR